VEGTYGPWDEDDQRARFFAANPTESHQIVETDGRPIGCLDVRRLDDQVKLNRVFLLPEFQNRGIGSQLIAGVLAEADAAGLPVHLRVFKINPARHLYRRLGFAVTDETETHLVMERAGPRR
jgi:GNAT superfamily N-acetyltransferase